MDCEKFEATMIDELYDELDELTSAAAKRHVSGCARCASLIGGLRATKRVAALPIVEPPDDLEDRILAAAKNAQKVVPMRGRIARAISRAGSWAMQPQTAMAAVFLLMIGSAVLLLRGRQAKAPASTPVTVTDEGAPALSPAPTTTSTSALAEEPAAAADSAHGPANKQAPSQYLAAAPSDNEAERKKLDLAKDKVLARGAAADDRDQSKESQIANASTPAAGVPNTLPQAPGAQQNAPPPPSPTAAGPQSGGGGYAGADFNNAMAAYNAGRYDEAARLFASLAPNDVYSALWEARSVREGSGKCRVAATKFDSVSGRAAGTIVGYDALLEGGRCYRVIGQPDVARERLTRLLPVPSHEARARAELQAMGGNPAAAKASPRAAPAPAQTATGSMKSDQSY